METGTIKQPASVTEPQKPNVLLNSLYEHITRTWDPIEKGDCTTLYLSTIELYEILGNIYPELPISPNELATWLYENGYRYTQMGETKIYWMLKQKRNG